VALQVSHNSRSLAKKALARTFVQIPGNLGWRPIYINQASDFFVVAQSDVQINHKVSRTIFHPGLVNRVVISGVRPDKGWLEKSIMCYFDQLSGLKEVILTDRERPYLMEKLSIPSTSSCKASKEKSELVQQLQRFFEDRNGHVLVTARWHDGN
jgi:hypothetical protein